MGVDSFISVVVITGLGKDASNVFVTDLQHKFSKQSLRAKLYQSYIDANVIIPILGNGRELADKLSPLGMISHNKLPGILLIPCNSVHIASPYLKQIFGNSFIPIDEATISEIFRSDRQGRFLILGTSTTVESGMYQDSLRRLECESAVLPPSIQSSFDDFIFKELVKGEMNNSHLHTLRELETRYMELLGANHVILACTELCYLVQVFSSPLACEIDSLQALHNAGIGRLQILLRDKSNYAN